jgi:hypothetical protein
VKQAFFKGKTERNLTNLVSVGYIFTHFVNRRHLFFNLLHPLHYCKQNSISSFGQKCQLFSQRMSTDIACMCATFCRSGWTGQLHVRLHCQNSGSVKAVEYWDLLLYICGNCGTQILFFCDLKPYAKFPNRTINPSGRKNPAEREEREERENTPLLVDT